MSWQKSVLNYGLRMWEKPYLARVQAPEELRRGFERRARFFFRMPRGVSCHSGAVFHSDRDVPVLWATPNAVTPEAPVLLYFHGGGFVFGSPQTHVAMLARLAQLSGVRACLPAYRLAPENPFPAALQDANTAFAGLLAEGVAPSRILLGGDSAGGGLALALLADLCSGDGPRPAGLFALSPLTDLTFSGDSFLTNVQADVLLPASRDRDLVEMYLQGADPSQPLASPLFACFAGAPPVYLCAGDTEILLDDTRRLAIRMRDQGLDVAEHIVRDLPHVWPIFWHLLPEGAATLSDIAGWIRRQLPRSDEN